MRIFVEQLSVPQLDSKQRKCVTTVFDYIGLHHSTHESEFTLTCFSSSLDWALPHGIPVFILPTHSPIGVGNKGGGLEKKLNDFMFFGYEINQKVWVNLQKSKTLAKWVSGRIMQQVGKVHQCQLRHNACKEPDTNENFPMPRPLQQLCQTELEIADRHDGQSSEGEKK
ncbi:hypothetical protein PR048_021397, partial [Dryococelus australis]